MTALWIPILIIWIVMIVDGYKKGLLRIAISFGVSILLILMLSPLIESVLLEYTPILQYLEQIFMKVTSSAFSVGGTVAADISGDTANQFPLLEEVVKSFVMNTSGSVFELLAVNNLIVYAAGFLADFCVKVIAFLITLILSNVLLHIVFDLLKIVDKLPVIGWINKVGGVLLGAAEGILCLWILFAVLMLFSQSEIGGTLVREITGDMYLNFLYENNLLVQYIVAIIEM